jgi:putative transposase
MRRSQHSDAEILTLLGEARRGVDVEEICRAAHVTVRTFYRWRKRFEGVTPDGVGRLNELEAEIGRLKRRLKLAEAKSPGRPAAGEFAVAAPLRPECGFLDGRGFAAQPSPTGAGARIGRFASLRV